MNRGLSRTELFGTRSSHFTFTVIIISVVSKLTIATMIVNWPAGRLVIVSDLAIRELGLSPDILPGRARSRPELGTTS